MNNPYKQVQEFHKAFGHEQNDKPTPMSEDTALNRAIWTGEELVELLYASVGGDKDKFERIFSQFLYGLDKAREKTIEKNPDVSDKLVAQADALTDVMYFNYGSFAILGVEPQPLFDIVQDANMGKLWEVDGKLVPKYREEDGKIMKPPHWEEVHAPEGKIKEEINRQLED